MTLLLTKLGIDVICGAKNLNKINDDIFSKNTCDFLNSLSEAILSDKKLIYPDIVTFAFWLRKKNLLKYAKQFTDENKRVGLGIAYHITPSNIPTNFAYSFVFGLVSGNSNIIKMSEKDSVQGKYLIKIITLLFKDKKYKKLKESNSFIKYKHNEEINTYLSKHCDARIIWGGNKTINQFKKAKTHERVREVNFPDRYSICLINADYIKKLSEDKYDKLLQNFFNDTYLVDQNACSSPKLIIWLSKDENNIKREKNKFWKKLESKLSNYKLDSSLDYKKYNILCEVLTKGKFKVINSLKNNKLYILKMNSLMDLSPLTTLKLGIFFEYDTDDLDEVFNIKNKNIQTLSYAGFNKKDLYQTYEKNSCETFDRIVPIGRVLDMDLNWDGYTIPYELSRIVDIR